MSCLEMKTRADLHSASKKVPSCSMLSHNRFGQLTYAQYYSNTATAPGGYYALAFLENSSTNQPAKPIIYVTTCISKHDMSEHTLQ